MSAQVVCLRALDGKSQARPSDVNFQRDCVGQFELFLRNIFNSQKPQNGSLSCSKRHQENSG